MFSPAVGGPILNMERPLGRRLGPPLEVAWSRRYVGVKGQVNCIIYSGVIV